MGSYVRKPCRILISGSVIILSTKASRNPFFKIFICPLVQAEKTLRNTSQYQLFSYVLWLHKILEEVLWKLDDSSSLSGDNFNFRFTEYDV